MNILALLKKFLLFVVLKSANSTVKWNPGMKSFTHSIKQGGCTADQEISLFEYTKGPGVVTEQWFTGKGCIDETTIVRYYIDGEEDPSIEVNLYLSQGIGFPGKGNKRRNSHTPSETKQRKAKAEHESLMSLRKRDKLNRNTFKNQILNDHNTAPTNEISDETVVLKRLLMKIKGQHTELEEESNASRRTQIDAQAQIDDSNLPNPLKDLFHDKTGSNAHNFVQSNESGYDDSLIPDDDVDSQAESRTEPTETESDPGVPWGTRRMGHLASNGAIYSTIRIPFQKSIYVSLIATRHGHYWYNVRGVQNYPLIIGDLELPKTAKLRVYKQENITVLPFEYIFLASSFNKSGLLYMVTLNTESKNFYHQEACFRAIIDNEEDIQYLSSGTEDLFLSAYYFNGGIYHNDQSGLSYKDDPGRLCAYKFFEDDPVLFNQAFSLVWRCGELADNKCFKIYQKDCTRKYGRKKCITSDDHEAVHNFNEMNKQHTKAAIIYSYVWIYEW